MNIDLKISKYNRTKKYNCFLQELNPSKESKILDVGFIDVENYSSIENFLEKNYLYLHNITALGLSGGDVFKRDYPGVTVVLYDGNIFPFDDKLFDIGWSNAVLEHVGNEDKQILFLKEMHRTCKQLYFTTPNRYFPFELHSRYPLIHWLPKKTFDRILMHTRKRFMVGDYMHLLSCRKLKSLLKKAGITQYKIIRNRLLGFTLDFSVVVK
jgi:SAM-dependent methyltransferase